MRTQLRHLPPWGWLALTAWGTVWFIVGRAVGLLFT